MLELMLATAVQAAPPTRPPPLLPASFSLLCQSDESVGFSWSNGAWGRAVFELSQRIVIVNATNNCRNQTMRPPQMDPLGGFRSICLNERRVGDPYYDWNSVVCQEHYFWNDRRWHISISCRHGSLTATFSPDGEYQLATMTGDVMRQEDNSRRRDTLSIEVGRCALVPS